MKSTFGSDHGIEIRERFSSPDKPVEDKLKETPGY
jgi:hypothetical protein